MCGRSAKDVNPHTLTETCHHFVFDTVLRIRVIPEKWSTSGPSHSATHLSTPFTPF